MTAANASPVSPEAVEKVCEVLSSDCSHFANGSCSTRACMAKNSLDPKALEFPIRFVGCETYKAVIALRALSAERVRLEQQAKDQAARIAEQHESLSQYQRQVDAIAAQRTREWERAEAAEQQAQLLQERVRPPIVPTPEWLQRARREGRAEALALLMQTSAEEFDGDCDYIGSHAIGDTGDYGCHWNVEKLRELFEVREEDGGEIERLEALYWQGAIEQETRPPSTREDAP